jgi:hypothetical protein
MADNYIDYFEVSEYGNHFVSEAKKLSGLSKLVDIDALRARVQSAVDEVNGELQNAGIQRSDLRCGRDTTAQAVPLLRDALERFYHHLLSLPVSAGIDVDAFFPGKTLGNLSRLKPADLAAKADQVLHGFATKSNGGVAGLTKWQSAIEDARSALGRALKGKHSARGASVTATAGLLAARERFVGLYSGVAKPLVRGLLSELGRAKELDLFFVDLQVNEGSPRKRGVDPSSPTGTVGGTSVALTSPVSPPPAG